MKLITKRPWWVTITAAIALLAVMAYANGTPTAQAAPTDSPGISVPICKDNGIFMYWHTKQYGNASAPDGWKVERRNRHNNNWVTKTWIFTGAASDALQVYSDRYWDWKDTSARTNVGYTYRVHAINTDESFMTGRKWSRRAVVNC